jgi:REP element-mobilizing transposase RayT
MCLFGNIDDGNMTLNQCGLIARQCLNELADHFNRVELDENIVMPNHIHTIIKLNRSRRGTACRAPTLERFGKPVSGSIPTIIRSYKSAVTKLINNDRNTPTALIWQRNYYEHIIRDEIDLSRVRKYIINNPVHWERDEYNTKKEKTCHRKS